MSRSREGGWAPLNLLLPNLPDSSVPVTRPIYQGPVELRRKTDQLQNIAKCKIKKKVVSNACLCYYQLYTTIGRDSISKIHEPRFPNFLLDHICII